MKHSTPKKFREQKINVKKQKAYIVANNKK